MIEYKHTFIEEKGQHLIIVDMEHFNQALQKYFRQDVKRQIPQVGEDFTVGMIIDDTIKLAGKEGNITAEMSITDIPEESWKTYTYGEGIEMPNLSDEILEKRQEKNKEKDSENDKSSK